MKFFKVRFNNVFLVLLFLGVFGAGVYAQDNGDILDFIPAIIAGIGGEKNGVYNGWYVDEDLNVIWGYAAHNSWWGADSRTRRPNITRNSSSSGPLGTVNFNSLTNAMLAYGYPGFEHNYGLWYDRRRDSHDTACRTNSNVEGPTLEQPWGRSGTGRACDGETLYDLYSYNQWYFNRLASFAAEAQKKGVIFFNNFYMQHALLEITAHYADFAWRPGNNIQNVPMPSRVPAANSFYNVANAEIRAVHVAYINKMLDTLGSYPNVVHLISQEYTGSLTFMNFWIDTIKAWERANGKQVHIGLSATKDVQDAVLANSTRNKDIQTIDLRYWWYESNGSLFAPRGGINYAGRYNDGEDSAETSAKQIYRQVREYSDLYPEKAIVHSVQMDTAQTWAFLMGGGAMNIYKMYYDSPSETRYVAPTETVYVRNTYNFINTRIRDRLPSMKPMNLYSNQSATVWCLANDKDTFLYYLPDGGNFQADLRNATGQFTATWLYTPTGSTRSGGTYNGGSQIFFNATSQDGWALLLKKN